VTDRVPDGRETVAGAFPERTDDAHEATWRRVAGGSRVRHRLTARFRDLYTPPVHIRMPMKKVNVTELRQNLPGYLARVRRGERIKVTSRGQVVAELAPPAPSPDDVAAARARLRDSVRRYERPLEPIIDPGEWDMNR